MKNSVKKFLAVALVGGALFGATGAQAYDRGHDDDRGRNYERGYDNARGGYDRDDHYNSGYDKRVVHVYKRPPERYVERNYHSRPQYSYNEGYRSNPGRLLIGFNF